MARLNIHKSKKIPVAITNELVKWLGVHCSMVSKTSARLRSEFEFL